MFFLRNKLLKKYLKCRFKSLKNQIIEYFIIKNKKYENFLFYFKTFKNLNFLAVEKF